MNEQQTFESEYEKINAIAKQTGDAIIDISQRMEAEMQKWSNTPDRPYELSPTECVGFINKTTADGGLNLVVDLQAPDSAKDATVRIWAIASEWDDDQNELFNNIQMTFSTKIQTARAITRKGGDASREDIRMVMHDGDTQLSRVIVSDKSGVDKAKRHHGKRHDLTIATSQDTFNSQKTIALDDFNQTLSAEKVSDILQIILGTLEEAALRPL